MTVWTEFEPLLGTADVGQNLLHLAVVGSTDDGPEIEAHLAERPRGLRIRELFTVLDPTREAGRGGRITQWKLLDGAWCEPLTGSSGATSAPHAQARAS